MDRQTIPHPMTRAVIVLTAILTGTVAIAIMVATVDFSNLRLKEDLEMTGLRTLREINRSQSADLEAESAQPTLPDPGAGCEWIPMSGHGISFFALYCGNVRAFTRLVPTEEGFAVETELGMGDLPRIEIIRKDPGESAEAAIREQILSRLTGAAAEGCVVETAGNADDAGLIRHAIVTTGDYHDLWERRFAEDPSYRPCGHYGPKESIAYFVSSPEAPDKLVYLEVGQDAPPFSPESLKFLDEAGLSADCEAADGRWLSMYNECEYADSGWCAREGGEFMECESACRHELNAQICTLQCVPVCMF